MGNDERVALLGLLVSWGEKWSDITDRVEERGSARRVLEELHSGQQSLFGSEDDVDAWTDQARQMLEAWDDEGIRFVSLFDDDYPSQLRSISRRPPFVTWIGAPEPSDADGVAIVGTREATAEGLQLARGFAIGLADRGICVISGLAAGIDTAAHRGALEVGGRTVAVIGTGLHSSYPKQNTELQAEIGRKGMVLSQFLPDASPTKFSFPMRNAVMSGYSSATLVVQAGFKSGARLQARLACEQGRLLLLHIGLRNQEWANELATRPGACFVESLDDVLAALATRGRSTHPQFNE